MVSKSTWDLACSCFLTDVLGDSGGNESENWFAGTAGISFGRVENLRISWCID